MSIPTALAALSTSSMNLQAIASLYITEVNTFLSTRDDPTTGLRKYITDLETYVPPNDAVVEAAILAAAATIDGINSNLSSAFPGSLSVQPEADRVSVVNQNLGV